MVAEEFWDKRQSALFLGVSRATFDRYVVRFRIQKFGVEGGRKTWFRAEDVRGLIRPLQDGSLPELDAAPPLTSTATAPELSAHFARRQRGRAAGQLVLPASSWGESALLAGSLLGVLAWEAGALGAPSLMLAAAPLAARFVVQTYRRCPPLTLGATTPRALHTRTIGLS